MESVKDRYETWKNIKVGVLTWNLAGKQPPPNMDVSRVLLPESRTQEFSLLDENPSQKDDGVDLYVVGL